MTISPKPPPIKAIEVKRLQAEANRQRIARAITSLQQAGAHVNVLAVAREAEVSPDTVRRSGDLYDEVKRLRVLPPTASPSTAPNASVSGTVHTALKGRYTAALAENADLRRELAVAQRAVHQALGTSASGLTDEEVDGLQQETAELRVSVIELQREIRSLREERGTLAEDLTAARELNREYVRELSAAKAEALSLKPEIVRARQSSG